MEDDDDPTRDALSIQVDVIVRSGLFDHRWYLERYPDVRGSDAVAHYVLSGAAERRDPGPGFSTAKYLAAYPDVVAAGINPLVHYVLYGRAEARSIAAPDDVRGSGAPSEPPSRGSPATGSLTIGGDALGPCTAASRGRLGAVAAFAAAHHGRLPVVSAEGEGAPTFDPRAADAASIIAVVGQPLGGGAVLDDARYLGGDTLVLTLSGEALAVAAYQYAGDALVRVGELPAGDAAPRAWSLALADPLLPLLIGQCDRAGVLTDARVLVFPSLLPGGLHADEARALGGRAGSRVDVGRALAVEHLKSQGPRIGGLGGDVQPVIARWFDTVFGAGDGPTLHLTEGAIPCVGALTAALSPATAGMSGGWIATTGDGAARALIALPLSAGGFPATLDPPAALAVPLAVRRPLAATARPAAGARGMAGGVTVVVDRIHAVDVAPLLDSLAAQEGAAAIEVVLLGDAALPPVPSALSGRVRAGDWPNGPRAIVVRVDAAVRLPDPATLGVLAAMLDRHDVAAVSCIQTTAERRETGVGGYSTVSVSLDGRPGIVVREVALPLGTLPSTLPMLALSHRLIAVRAQDALALRGDGCDAALLAGIGAIEAGRTNLLATGVVAITVLAPDLSERVDPVSPAVLSPERIAALLDRIATVTPV